MKKVFTPLIEKAVPKDAFKHQTHERIAITLSNLLIANKGKGQTIGLEGVWGSGKSTVISILENKLEKNNDFTFFYFDAWAHEGDPLRRVFLESLIKRIDGNDNELEELSKQISNRKKTITTNTFRQATWFGRFMSVSLFFVPLGAAIISTINFSKITFKLGYSWCWELIIGALFTLAPILVVLANFCYLKYKKLNYKDRKKWSFLEDKSETNITQEISEDEEKSSIEFEKYFEDIITIAFNGQTNKQLVAVIDNLDRIDAQDSLKIWSTLQTFLKQRNPGISTKTFSNNIWIIVPYDAEGLAKLWDTKDIKCSNSFFNKNFQIRLEVPKPILSDWEDFTSQMIDNAFGQKFKYKRDILDTIRITRKDINDTLTPREIKTLINQLGVLWLNSDDDMPIASVTYYSILRYLEHKEIEIIKQGLIKGEIPDKSHKAPLPETIIEDLSGLSFGVPSKIGQQLLILPELKEGLKIYNEGQLERLAQIHENGFWWAFDYHLERTSPEDIFTYSNAIYKGLWEKYNSKCDSYILALENKTIQLSSFNNIDNFIGITEIFLKSDIPFKHFWKSIILYLSKLFTEILKDIDQINKVLSAVIKRVPENQLAKYKIKTTQIQNWIDWSITSYENNLSLYKWIVPEEKYYEELPGLIIAGSKIPEGIAETVKYFFEAKPEEWFSMVEACEQHIIWNNGTGNVNQHSTKAVDILFTLCFDNSFHKDKIEALLKDGRFYNYIHHQIGNGLNIEYVALLIAIYFTKEIHNFQVPAVAHANNGLQIARNFWITREKENVEVIDVYIGDDIELIWELANDLQNKLIGEFISYSLANDNIELFKVENALGKYRNSLELNKDIKDFDIAKLGQFFLMHSNLESEIKVISKEDIIEYDEELDALFENLKNKTGIKNGLKSLEESDWKNGFEEDAFITSLALEVRKKDKSFVLENSYYDALLNFAKSKIMDISTLSNWQKSNWKSLVDLLSPDFLAQFRNNLTVAYSLNLSLQNIESLRFNIDYLDLGIICKDNLITIQTEIEASIKNETKLSVLKNILYLIKPDNVKFEATFKPVVKEPLNTYWNNTANPEYKQALEEIAIQLGVKLLSNSDNELE